MGVFQLVIATSTHGVKAIRKIAIAIMLTLVVGMTLGAVANSPNFLVKAQLPTQVKIMPLGDSITLGYPDVEGYRKDLYLDLNNSGFHVDFVGSQSNGTGFDSDNEGHINYYANDIRDNVYGWLVSNPADIVLLHIGTNDIQSGQDVPGIVAEVESILDNIDQWESNNGRNITVVIARIILRSDSPSLYDSTVSFDDALQTMVSTRIASGDNLIIVDMEHALSYPADLTSDEIHPNASGYGKMAVVWYNALINLLSYSLTVNCEHGVVTKFPDQASYPYGTEVALTVSAAEGWTFNAWSGDLTGSVNPETITMDGNKTVTANFTHNQYLLTMDTNFGTTSPALGGSLFYAGSLVTIYAVSPSVGAGERYVWNGWIGSGLGSYTGMGNNTDLVTMNGPITETGSWSVEFELAVATNLGSAEPSVGDHWVAAGTSVVVEALPPAAQAGVQFVCLGWSGTGSVPASGTESVVNFTMNEPSSVTWIWKTRYYLDVSSHFGSVGGAGWYDAGSSAYATISPLVVVGGDGAQYVFSGWSGGASGSSSASNTIEMDSPKTALANWSPVPTVTPTPVPTAIPTATPTSNPTVSPSPSPSPSGAGLFSHVNSLVVGVMVLGVLLAGTVAGFVVLRRKKNRSLE